MVNLKLFKTVDNIIIIFIFTIALIKSVFFSFFGLNFFDYGETLHNGVRILEGLTLYKDIWAFFPPADNYFPAILMYLFGENLLTVRIFESILFSFFVVVISLLTRKLLNNFFTILLSLLIIFADLNTYLLFFCLFFYSSILFLKYFHETDKAYYLVLSGLSLGVGGLFRHDYALVNFVTILVLIFLEKLYFKKNTTNQLITNLSYFITGLTIVILPITLWLFYNEQLFTLLNLGFIKAPQISRILSSGLNVSQISFTPAYFFNLFTAICYLLYVLTYFFIGLGLIKRKINYTILLLFTFGLLLMPYAFSVIDMGHLVKAGLPALILGTYLIQEKVSQSMNQLLKFIYLSPLLFILLVNVISSVWWINFNDLRLNYKNSFVYINSTKTTGSAFPTAATLNQTVNFIRGNTQENDYIFAAPYHAMIYFLSERKDPSKFNNFAAGFVSNDEQEEVIEDIKLHNVKVVVYDPENAPNQKNFPAFNPKIHQFIMENYEMIEETENGWLLMKRKTI